MVEGKVMANKTREIVSERRRYVRISPPSPIHVKYRFVEGYSEPSHSPEGTLSCSVSGGGLFLELPYMESEAVEELLRGDKKLSLEIDIPNRAESIKALGKVVWMEGKKEGNRHFYGAGVSFVRIDEDDRDEIINYIIDLYLQEKKSPSSTGS